MGRKMLAHEQSPGAVRLLILGSQFEMAGLVKKAKQRGYYTVVCDGFPGGCVRPLADKDYLIDVRKIDDIVDLCHHEDVNAIITSFSDIMAECMIRIAEKAGLPCYLSTALLPYYRDKEITKATCRKAGISVPRFVKLKSGFRDEEIAGINFPAVLKPVDSYGSRGIQVVYDAEQVARCFAQSSRFTLADQGEALLEEFSTGKELNCQAVVSDGKVYLLSVADRATAFFRRGHVPVNYALYYPSHHLEAADAVQKTMQKYVDATGQRQGPLAMQCFWDGETVTVCEFAARFFGFEHELTEAAFGTDLESLLLDLAISPESFSERFPLPQGAITQRAKRITAGLYLNSDHEGVLADQSALSVLAHTPGVFDSHLFYTEGEAVEVLGPKQYFARYYLESDTPSAVRAQIKAMIHQAHAWGENGEELLWRPELDEE